MNPVGNQALPVCQAFDGDRLAAVRTRGLQLRRGLFRKQRLGAIEQRELWRLTLPHQRRRPEGVFDRGGDPVNERLVRDIDIDPDQPSGQKAGIQRIAIGPQAHRARRVLGRGLAPAFAFRAFSGVWDWLAVAIDRSRAVDGKRSIAVLKIGLPSHKHGLDRHREQRLIVLFGHGSHVRGCSAPVLVIPIISSRGFMLI